MLIGLLTDTHMPGSIPTLWEEVRRAFQGVDLILHGGDIQTSSVLDWLESIAPVLAARGNNDGLQDDPRVKDLHLLDLDGWRVGLIHDLEPEDRPIEDLVKRYFRAPVDIMVSGHTHFERLDFRDGVLQINSGSPTYPHQYSTRLGTVGLLRLATHGVEARIVLLGNTPGLPNPGAELALTVPVAERHPR